MDEELLASGLERIGIAFSDEAVKRISVYISEIMLFNPTLKLVGDTDPDGILIRHVLDSAAAWPVFMEMTEKGTRIADLGSGAGFPGIVLAILMPDREFVLLERMKRRALFLQSVIARTGLGNVRVDQRDLRECSEVYDCITARAFHPLYDIAEDVMKIISPSSVSIFYKGRRANVTSELDVLRGEGYSFQSTVRDIRVPYLDEMRSLCILTDWIKQ